MCLTFHISGAAATAGDPTAARAAGPSAAETAASLPAAEPEQQLFRCRRAAEQAAVHPRGQGAAGQAQPVRRAEAPSTRDKRGFQGHHTQAPQEALEVGLNGLRFLYLFILVHRSLLFATVV